MKKLLGSMLLMCIFASSMQYAHAEGVYGIIYKNAVEPGVGFSTATPNKNGQATCTSFFGIVGLGNCSVNEAAKNGKIRNITYYDTHTLNILGFKRVTVNVYGN